MTIIVTKPGIIIDVVGYYYYDKKIMIENGLFVLGGPETQLHDIFGSSMTEKTMVEVRARKISGSSWLRWVVGGQAMRVSLIHVRTCVQRIGL